MPRIGLVQKKAKAHQAEAGAALGQLLGKFLQLKKVIFERNAALVCHARQRTFKHAWGPIWGRVRERAAELSARMPLEMHAFLFPDDFLPESKIPVFGQGRPNIAKPTNGSKRIIKSIATRRNRRFLC